MSIVTEYPFWFIFFCIFLGAGYAFLLYKNDTRFRDAGKTLVWLMTSLRFVSVLFISFLLLSPLIRNVSYTIEKPIIILAQDNSESIKSGKNDLSKFATDLALLNKNLSEAYEVRPFSFSDSVQSGFSFNYNGKYTNLAALFPYFNNNFQNRNVGALIIASDGISNLGNDPLIAISDVSYPVYIIALGDTLLRRDLILGNIKHNKTVPVGSKFPISMELKAFYMAGKSSDIKIFEDKKLIATIPVVVSGEKFNKISTIQLDAKEKGIHRYRIEWSAIEGEYTRLNNVKDVMIEVVEDKYKILLIGNSPHPDLGAIKSVLDLNENYQTDLTTIYDLKKNISDYQLVVLHQIPAVSNAAALIFSDLARNGTSFWIIAGAQTSIPNFNNLNFGFQIPIPNTFEETQLEYNEGFGLFETGNEMRAFFKSLPSMLSPSGAISNNSGLRPMFYKKQNGITTTQPIFAFNPEGSGNFGKYAILAGEGIWRWRVFDYKLHDNHQLFNELINKIVQLLIKKDNKERFKIITKKIFSENEHVFFEAEAYNESYELVNKNDVVMDILDSINKKIAYTFDKNNKSYVLNVGNFPVGDYQYKASTVIEDKKFEKSGRFSVIPVHVEQENTVANHQMLYQLAYKTGGKLIYPNQIASLQQELNKNKTINAVSFANKSLEEFINLKWLFAWIVLLIAVEWFLRKFLGAY